ncbi:HIT domain-containing protein [Aliidiomarina celeris]|uniref:HIT domain-containing protein n=1 Tax=Aliidiomarina celeris TaxID=2249428 RepID=UPI000DEAD024|nr:HIT domain-containing protein [Aliidiomarina celeris]
MSWQLHAQLANDTRIAGDLPLSRVLVMNDRHYPWVILVPRVADIREIYELGAMEQQQLLQESSRLSMFLMERFQGDKMNVAALGNMVPQLHVHHIVRFKNDLAWPQPVWGKAPAEAYPESELSDFCSQLATGLKLQPAISSSI